MAKLKALLGLDVGSQSVKVVEMSYRKNHIQIQGLGYAEFVDDSRESRRQVVKEVLSEMQSKRCNIGISGRSVCVRYVPLMAANEGDLKRSLVFEADKHIPFELDEVYLDGENVDPFPDLGESAEVQSVLVAAKKNVVDGAADAAEEYGLIPTIVDVESFALGNTYDYQMMNRESEDDHELVDDEAVVALIDVGAFKTTLNIVQNGKSHFSREIYFGGNDFEQAIQDRQGIKKEEARKLIYEEGASEIDTLIGPVIEELAEELKMALDFHENQYSIPVTQVRVSGGAARARSLVAQLTLHFGIQVELWDPFVGFDVGDLEVDQFGVSRSQFAVALGLAVRVRES